ncbi:hypothetical protein AVEN_159092-1 [Araneus ventricosus]|uniref:Uncharacterized protein n=1 Tax=Araneus ventricosus TaxID=182803 RepID=A0A4Y2BB46_ARAVE|nr:hypothetical protein AVEN_159092-1 [Araneus ventricosus]
MQKDHLRVSFLIDDREVPVYNWWKGNPYKNHADLAQSRPVYRSDGRCNSSSAEVGVLMAITGCNPTPSVGGTQYHQRASPNHYCTHQGSKMPLTYAATSHPRTRGAPSGTVGGKADYF